MKKVFTYVVVMTLIVSCGPSAQEKAAIENEVIQKLKAHDDSIAAVKAKEEEIRASQKRHDDSIANAVASVYKQKEADQSNKEMLTDLKNQYNNLQRLLVEDDSKLTVLVDKKNKDAEVHIGRTQAQREQWLKNEQRDIDNMKIQMENIKTKMQEIKSKIGS